MKIKDIERTANVAWSPKNQHPIYIAAGTAASQLDASFSTNAALELYALNIGEPGPDTQLISSQPGEHRFHKIIWGSAGSDSMGTIIAGCDDGLIQVYGASKLLKNSDALLGKQQKHSGPVHALDFNKFQHNLFASGAGESEIFIWDLNNTTTPMSPGAKSQPLEDILSVAWNQQVQHILASSFASKCVIWDLRKNEPIIKLTDTVSRIRWKMVAWHPEVATQLCLASEEDHSPVIQLWDLRFATSPLKTLENHQRGVLALSWCPHDSDLLVSCGKDDRILCWNPNSNHPNGEVLSEIAKTNQWSFDVVWSPRNPALIACPNYDGHVSVYSLMGGKTQQIQTSNKIADSFPGMDGFVQAPAHQQSHASVSVDPSKPPKWLRKPVGASFGFGGRLISFENVPQNTQPGQPAQYVNRTVQISQVITEPEFVRKSAELENALESGNFVEYCLNKADASEDQHKKYIWHFLKANFEHNPRTELLNLLGYRIEDVNNKLGQHIGKPLLDNRIEDLTDQLSGNRLEDYDVQDPFYNISQQNGISKSASPFKINTSDDTEGLITQALLLNNVEAAVELCLKAERYADALIIAATGGPDLLAKTQNAYLEKSEGYVSNLISALVSEDWASIINNCEVSSWKEALAATLTHASEEDLPILCEQLGARLESESRTNPKYAQDAQLCYICSGNFDRLVSSWSGNDLTDTKDLQELVELASFLQKSVERQGKTVQISGALADLLSRYASLLAGQGNLQTALSYLGSSQDERVVSLRDRLLTAIGQKPLNIQEMRQQQSNRRSSTRTSFTGHPTAPFNPATSFVGNQFNPPQQAVAAQPPPPLYNNNFNTGLPNAAVAPSIGNQAPWQAQAVAAPSNSQMWQPQPAAVVPPPKPFSPAPPPRPDSVGSARGTTGGGGGLSRKHVRDPSVSNSQYPAADLYGAPFPSQQPIPPAFDQYGPGSNAGGFGQPQVFQPTFGSTGLGQQMPGGSFNPAPFNPTAQAPIEAAQPAINYQAQAAPGWNDPPVLNRPSRQQQQQPKPENAPLNPITHPLYGATPVQQSPANGYGEPPAPFQPPPIQPYPNHQFPGNNGGFPAAQAPTRGNFYNAVQGGNLANAAAPPSSGAAAFNPANFNQNAIAGAAGAPSNVPPPVHGGAQPQQQQQQPPPTSRQGVLPSEHEVIHKVFENLLGHCERAATNPQMRRKFEDVSRRLDALYDSLRDGILSANAISGLHQIVELVKVGDYAKCLQLHTQLVQGPDFAQIASFMPGLKVLIQLALQLHVYLS